MMDSLIPLMAQFLFMPSIPVLLIWNVAPAVLYYYFAKGLPNQMIWLVVVFIFGWLGFIIALFFGPKPKRRS